MTDITTEDLLEVARGVFPDAEIHVTSGEIFLLWHPVGRPFNPLTDDADAFKVLKMLIAEDCMPELDDETGMLGKQRYVCGIIIDAEPKKFFAETVNESIVKAYLSLIKD